MSEDFTEALTRLANLRKRLISVYEEVFVGKDASERDSLLQKRAEAIRALQEKIVAQEQLVDRIRGGGS